MVKGLWGKKIGMAQVFTQDKKAVPVTVIDTSNWLVTQIKTLANDGYDAIKVACLRPRYHGKAFDAAWLKSLKTYFCVIREVKLSAAVEGIAVGQPAPFEQVFAIGEHVDVVGWSKGRGFAGAVKRHGFAGGPASHGSMFHRRTGSSSFMRSRGRIIKGKRFPGHMGVERTTIKNLTVVSFDVEKHMLLLKGSVPGSTGCAVYVEKIG